MIQKNNLIKAFSLIELSIVILIIGLLVAGIVKGSQIVKKFNVVAAQNVSSSSPLNYMKGVTIWYDATSAKSLENLDELNDNSLVDSWRDVTLRKSLNERINVAQSNSNKKPKFNSSAINGLPALRFDGNDQLLRSSILPTDLASADEVSFFIVQKYYGGNAFNFAWLQNGDISNRISTHARNSSNFFLILVRVVKRTQGC